MRHIPDGVLRRLDDEPLAVPDRLTEHVIGCVRCSTRRALIAEDTERAARLLSAQQWVADTDVAWARLRRELHSASEEDVGRRWPRPARWRRQRFPRLSLRAGVIIAALGIVVAGTATAASLTTIFAPTHVAPVSVSRGEVQSIAAFVGLGDNGALGGFPTADGSRTMRFGSIRWSSSGLANPVSSAADASAEAGLPVPLPTRLPVGVGAVNQFVVQPRVTATVSFSPAAASLDGSSVTLSAGPAVVAEYGGANRSDLPTLAIATMLRPTALSKGANLSQIEAFLLAQPGIPPQLAEEVRLLGDLRTTLPVPVPPGAAVRSVQVGGWPGVLLADSSNAAAGVIWEDGKGMLHVVAGILNSQDVLNVANQLG